MGTPADHLPPALSNDAINMLLQTAGIPQATAIAHPKVKAQYHSGYFLTLPHTDESCGPSELVLRVSGRHLPAIKTANEVGVMTWLSKNTTIPLPKAIAYSASTDNPISHEYTLLSRVKGVTLSDVYDSLSQEQIAHVLNQLIDFLCQLQDFPWDGIGGLVLNEQGEIRLGETVATLNIGGPYPTYIGYISAQVLKNVRLIQTHDKLAFMRDAVPRLESFVLALSAHADELNKVKLRLAHKDLHFANLVFDMSSGKITGVLDWDFSGVVPFIKWNPRRSSLWNGLDDATSFDEKQRLLELFTQRCEERGVSLLDDANYTSPLQESTQKAADFLRAIVEVSPRDQRQDLVQGWREIVLENIAQYGA
ncbi:hypothetical protein G7Z17_g3458 [Cylindrodendrum hubeiense]|uniref:Aminoglycoside phosphotransferase domain-containing protein n=1 Tax=Cylindrodendrum hubeiense TaxID=595255 RepID=A0A9P5LI50_9HYPO|nr:hypothetical protein G7Z17_g3458 [Cylindrodendrum hubeiense]